MTNQLTKKRCLYSLIKTKQMAAIPMYEVDFGSNLPPKTFLIRVYRTVCIHNLFRIYISLTTLPLEQYNYLFHVPIPISGSE